MAMGALKPVIVGVDGSAESLAAVDLAADEAAGRVAPLVLVHAADHASVRAPEITDLLDNAVARVGSEHPGLSVSAESLSGEPAAVLLDRGRSACLLVLGHRGHHRRGALPIGSVAMRVVNRAAVPVIVHRPLHTGEDVPLPRPVLVGVAGSENVVEFAFEEAALRGAPVHAVYVWSGSGDAPAAGIRGDLHGFGESREEAERMLAEAVAGWSEKYPDVAVCRTVRHSLDVTVALAAASRSAQLAVVGASGRSGLNRLLVGTVAQALLHRAGCPVAVVEP